MCRLCLPTTTLEQHFKYFKESAYSPRDIVDMVMKAHNVYQMEPTFDFQIQDAIHIKFTPTIDGTFREVPKELEEPKHE